MRGVEDDRRIAREDLHPPVELERRGGLAHAIAIEAPDHRLHRGLGDREVTPQVVTRRVEGDVALGLGGDDQRGVSFGGDRARELADSG